MPELITKAEAAERLRISLRLLEILIARGEGPRVTRLGRRMLFTEAALAEWIAARTEPARRRRRRAESEARAAA